MRNLVAIIETGKKKKKGKEKNQQPGSILLLRAEEAIVSGSGLVPLSSPADSTEDVSCSAVHSAGWESCFCQQLGYEEGWKKKEPAVELSVSDESWLI